MGDGGGKGIGGVIWFWEGFHSQKETDKFLYACLTRRTKSRYSLLYVIWSVFTQGNAVLGKAEGYHPPSLRYGHGTGYILGKVKGFHGRLLREEFLHKGGKAGINL